MSGGWEEAETQDEWTLIVPLKGGFLAHGDLRVGMTPTSLNLHVRGQDEVPMVGNGYQMVGGVVPTRGMGMSPEEQAKQAWLASLP